MASASSSTGQRPPRPLSLALLALIACGDPAAMSASASESQGTSGGDSAAETEAAETEAASETDTGDMPIECAPITVPVVDAPGERRFELVATRSMIPGLAEQPTSRGQILGSLFAFDGRLHLGYGDYSDNTGPIAMHAWDPSEGTFVDLGVLPTEEVLWFRAAAGKLYTPAIDPDTHLGIGGIYRLDCGAEGWKVGTPIDGAVHVYDVAIQGDTIYAGTGSVTGAPALLMASTDFGESWTEVHRRESAADEFSRFYFVGATPTRMFVSGSHDFASLRDDAGDGEFHVLSDPPPGSLVPVVLGEAMVIAAFTGNPGRSNHLASYRVEGPDFIVDSPWPALADESAKLITWTADADPERLLVLMGTADGSASLHRTDDLSKGATAWEELTTIDPLEGDDIVSMALLNNDLYLGTRGGSLYALREIQEPAR